MATMRVWTTTVAVIGAAIVSIAAAWGGDLAASARLARVEASRVSMGCVYAIEAYGDPATLPAILEDALEEVERIDRLLSNYKRESPLSRVNREAARGPVAVDPELFDFFEASLRYSRESGGAFDITVGPLMKAWGFFEGDGRMPEPAQLADARRRVGFEHVILDPTRHTVRFDVDGLELDPGGIGKGYAIDRVVSLLRQRGVTTALVSAGGSTIAALGAPPDEEGWTVTLDDPLPPGTRAMTFTLRDRSLSIAGAAGKFFDEGGRRYTHIMDPRTGTPVSGVLTVAVVTATGIDGDAWDDAFFVLGVEKSREIVKTMRGVEAYFLLPAGSGWKLERVTSVDSQSSGDPALTGFDR
jgi:thiamine biosynthesis lipoprotein